MSVSPIRDRRAERFEATRQEILAVAWELVKADGLAGLSIRELGSRVGLRAQSLYVYFPSKHAIYDAMFAEANRDMLDRRRAVNVNADPVVALRLSARLFVDFCTEGPSPA
jgi:AcrR family transcriptional regulator